MKKLIKCFVVPLLFAGQVLTPTYSWAQMSETGRAAQSFGKNLAESLRAQGASNSGGNIDMGAGNKIHINDLFPGTSGTGSKPPSYYFPDTQAGTVSSNADGLSGLYNDSSEMNKAGTSYHNSLLEDSRKDNPSLSGAAYQILRNQALKPKERFENDPMLRQSRDVYNNIDLIAEGFGDCKVVDGITQSARPVHVPVYETCENLKKPEGSCTATNDVRIESWTHEVFIASQGRNFVTMQVDLKNGTWQAISPSDGEMKVAQIPTLDYSTICGGGKSYRTDHVGTWDWVSHGIPGTPDSSVEYRVLSAPSCSNNLVGVLQIEDQQKSTDLDYVLGGNFTFKFTKLVGGKWSVPEHCAPVMNGVGDGFCDGTITTTGAVDQDGCSVISSVKICPGDDFYNAIDPSPIPNKASRLAQTISVTNSECKFNVGVMECWTDPQGVKHCPENKGESITSCNDLKNNPKCGFISSKCIGSGAGYSGQCYIYEDTYDCGYEVGVPQYQNSSQYQCAGPIKCMGDECLDINRESNGDFARASALLNAAQFMAQDMSCSDSATGEGGDENVDLGCRVFSGTPGTCKIAVGGSQDCCEKPENISLADYITMLMAVPKLDGAIMAINGGTLAPLKGAYQTLRDPVMQGWTEVSKPFVSYGENISGAVKEFVQPITDVYNLVVEELKKAVQEVISNAIENGLLSAGAEAGAAAGIAESASKEAADKAANEIMANIGNAASTIMTVYTVYVVAMTLIKIIWACEQKEFELNAKRQLKSCTHVGSYCKTKVLGVCVEKRQAYCCYNSPLSRIINEQIRTQKGWGFGKPEAPQCEGLTLDQISSVDWDRINLDEWLGILQETGHFPSPDGINLDSLTGGGSIFNTGGNRLNAQDRAQQRIDGLDVDKIRGKAEGTVMIPK